MQNKDQIPTKISIAKDKRTMSVAFEDRAFDFPAEALRVFSPSAEVQGHAPSQRKTISGKRKVEIMQVEPVGNYAIRITFDDMHSTGIFTWRFFRELGETYAEKWQAYLDELKSLGLSRDG